MKKAILLFISIMMCTFILVGCGGKNGEETTKKKVKITQPPTATETPTEDETDLSTMYKTEKFEKATDLRQGTVDAMRKMSAIEWVCTVTHTVKNQFNTWGINYTFEKGQVYHGLPYANAGTNYDEFARMIVDGKYGYDGDESWESGIPGNQCISSINQAIKTVADVNIKESQFMIPGREGFQEDTFSPVGDYTYEKGNTTEDIVTKNGAEKMYECYSKLQKGDVIISYVESSHARLVSEVVITKTPAGKPNFKRSYVVTLEQTNTLESMRNSTFISKNGYDSTWWIDHQYTFEELFGSNYIPLTFKVYGEEIKEPYIALDVEITPKILSAGNINGTVCSNFRIHHLIYQLINKDGTVESELFVPTARKNHNAYKANNRYNAEELFQKASHGKEYTFRMYVGIGPGEKLMSEVDFKYN